MEAVLNLVPLLFRAYEMRRERNQQMRLIRRRIRDAHDPFDMRDVDFKILFRISKDIAHLLVRELGPHLYKMRSTGLPVHVQILTAVRFYATGSYQRAVGQDMYLSVGQATVSKSIKKVSILITEVLAERYITFPATFEERQATKNRFMEARGFPGVIGCIDCTHIRIIKPAVREEAYFNNHYRCHSLNVQAVCDHDLRILSLSARFPGSVHDQFIWNSSLTRELMQRWYDEGVRNTWLLGDSGYALQPFLLTPIRHAAPNSPEERYTQCHCRTRNCVERLFGVMKTVWRCLHTERVLHYSPEVAAKITISCAVLHNLMVKHRLDLPDIMPIPDLEFTEQDEELEGIAAGEDIRRSIIRQFFT